jgi:hypothetical protein
MPNTIHSAGDFVAVSTSDTVDLPSGVRGFYIGGVGDVYVDSFGGNNNVKFTAVPAGTTLDVRAKRLRTGTTATAIVALF